ncbi:MAG: hypothetical protein AB2A00_08220 [Myxococcota bacterium]
MSVSGVKNTIRSVSTDRTIDKADAQKILDSAGSTVSSGEERAIKDVFNNSSVQIDAEAKKLLKDALRDISSLRAHVRQQNDGVAARASGLQAAEDARMKPGVTTKTLGGSVIPEEVKALVNKARAAGAVAYDVAELDDPAKDDHGEGYTVTGKWTPYPQDVGSTGNLAFSHTEVTPQKLEEDMNTVQTFTRIKGYRTETQRDFRTGEEHTFQVAEYERVTEKGTGNITAHYDEASHPDQYARGPQGQKWANNFCILADGSLHCLPAARRNPAEPGLILTNPSLARGQRMLFNGHIEVRNGVVTSIGMSGRLQKLAADGDAKFMDPVPLLKAWGFKMSPDLQVHFEGSGDRPNIDRNTNVIG